MQPRPLPFQAFKTRTVNLLPRLLLIFTSTVFLLGDDTYETDYDGLRIYNLQVTLELNIGPQLGFAARL